MPPFDSYQQDTEERERALNPAQSFIVQAPAGSGKTELLIQRFLVLLNYVKQPEEILAITFTKKAAAEMRSRIISALDQAQKAPKPSTPHAEKTWALARAVIERDRALNWMLLANPNRLRIQTIDAFNAYLTRQLPLLAHFGSPPDLTDQPEALYTEAIEALLSHLEDDLPWSPAIAQLLQHFDNDLAKLHKLLVSMLKRRDQWLPYLISPADLPQLKNYLEHNLTTATCNALERLRAAIPEIYHDEWLALADFAAEQLQANAIDSPTTWCRGLMELPGVNVDAKPYWLGLIELLLTKAFTWRKQWNKANGFPAPSSVRDADLKTHYATMKARMEDLVESLSRVETLDKLSEAVMCLPDPHYADDQWAILAALQQVLRVAVAQLRVVFQQHGKIDYIENAQAALAALGTNEAPTDLTLALDYQIRHILVDEFQDTSHSQYRLLEKLTAHWEAIDHRTLFIVGDPMQSIYRFREAEVSLFIRARDQGLGPIRLVPLTLSVNFRSLPAVVDWVNQHFARLFPAADDIATGAVKYAASLANASDQHHTACVALHAFGKTEEEARAIVHLIEQRQALAPHETIAILVRSRSHLTAIIPALKEARIHFSAVDIDRLATRPVIQDLMALTRALLHPADRIAWFALLRAPWCGLTLDDLLTLGGDDPRLTLWQRLQQKDIIERLTPLGKTSLHRVLPLLTQKLKDRGRMPLRPWIESTWLMLGGPACVEQPHDLEDANAFFDLLEGEDTSHTHWQIEALEKRVHRLYATAHQEANARLQIMTIHNAKGLEFDTVILPHLGKPPRKEDDKPLLLWMEHYSNDAERAWIMAPRHAGAKVNHSIYDYIDHERQRKDHYEIGRLLYVAATRAKKQLHGFFTLDQTETPDIKPAKDSLLDKLWGALDHNDKMGFLKVGDITDISKPRAALKPLLVTQERPLLKKLQPNWQHPLREYHADSDGALHQKSAGFHLADDTPRCIGIITHHILQSIGSHGFDWWQKASDSQKEQYIGMQWLRLGASYAAMDAATKTIQTAIRQSLADPRGQWILSPHTDAHNEWQLTAVIEGDIKQLSIDRTFIDNDGVRWIIDYKTAHGEKGKTLDAFLAKQEEQYRAQMQLYYQAMAAREQSDHRTIRLGFYFPLLPYWHELKL